MYELLTNKPVNWMKGRTSSDPIILQSTVATPIAADKIGYNGEYGSNGVQFANTPGKTLVLLERRKAEEIIFLDANLAAAIRTTLGLPETTIAGGKTITRPITTQDVASLKKLIVSDPILSLVGINKIESLEYLDIQGSLITNIDDLRGLINLKYLNLRNCANLSKITPLQDLPELQVVNVMGTATTDIAFISKLFLGLLPANSYSKVAIVSDYGPLGDIVENSIITLDSANLDLDTGAGTCTIQVMKYRNSINNLAYVSIHVNSMTTPSNDNSNRTDIQIITNEGQVLKSVADITQTKYLSATHFVVPFLYGMKVLVCTTAHLTGSVVGTIDFSVIDSTGYEPNSLTSYNFHFFLTDMEELNPYYLTVIRDMDISFRSEPSGMFLDFSPTYELSMLERMNASFCPNLIDLGALILGGSSLKKLHIENCPSWGIQIYCLATSTVFEEIWIEGTAISQDDIDALEDAGKIVHIDRDSHFEEFYLMDGNNLFPNPFNNEAGVIGISSHYSKATKRFTTGIWATEVQLGIDLIELHSGDGPCAEPSNGTLLTEIDIVNPQVIQADDVDMDFIYTSIAHGLETNDMIRAKLADDTHQVFFITKLTDDTFQLIDAVGIVMTGEYHLVMSVDDQLLNQMAIPQIFFQAFEGEDPKGRANRLNTLPDTIWGYDGTYPLSIMEGSLLEEANAYVNAVMIINPFLNTYVMSYEIVSDAWEVVDYWLMTDKGVMYTLTGDVVFDDPNWTLSGRLNKEQVDTISGPQALTPWFQLDQDLESEHRSSLYPDPTIGNMLVRFTTTKQIEGFDVDDLIIELSNSADPVLVFPFSNIFHAKAQVDGVTYPNLIRMDFQLNIADGVPTTGEIKVNVYDLS
jgi:hypothetical protein